MKLRNKKTGEIVELKSFQMEYTRHYDYGEGISGEQPCSTYNKTLSELNSEWEDVPEEPKEYWCLDNLGDILRDDLDDGWVDGRRKQIGNYFESEEEAELAVEKLKAWRRLKDKGFRFEGIKEDYTRILQVQDPSRTGKRYLQFNKSEDEDWMKENWEDLVLLFFTGGEE